MPSPTLPCPRFSRGRVSRALLPLTLLGLSAVAPASAADWNEAINGDFSNDGLAPTFVALNIGDNIIRGTTGRAVAGGPVDLDYFTVTVPAGQVLTSMEVLAGTAAVGSGSFIGLMAGNTFTVPPTAASAAGLLGWSLFDEGNVGGDLLLFMAAPSFGSTGFSTPLAPGNYSFWVQETGVGVATYAFALAVTAVPEPATLFSMVGGLALLTAALKTKR